MTAVHQLELPTWVNEVIAQVPGIRLEPLPHSVLPAPFDQYCLTPWLPSDIDQIVPIINHPQSKLLAWPKNGGVAIASDVRDTLEEGRDDRKRHFPLNILRRVESLGEAEPELVGLFRLHPGTFRPYLQRQDEKREANLDLPSEERKYEFAPLCSVDLRGQGLSTATVKHQFHVCPWIRKPGQLNAGWLVGNEPSRRMHYRLEFEPVAKVTSFHAGIDGVFAVWAGLGKVTKTDSAWSELEDLGDVDLGPYEYAT